MEIYFNPYSGAAKTEEEGLNLAIGTADALIKLKKECSGILLSSIISKADGDLPPSQFVLVRNSNSDFTISSLIYKTKNAERDKLRFLLNYFNTGKVIDNDDLINTDGWILSDIGPAPVLEFAAKNNAITLTIPTEEVWRVDVLKFDGRPNILHNLWGQKDISEIINYCIDSLQNSQERFQHKFDAEFCPGATNSAPDTKLWEFFGYFKMMERAQDRDYYVDGDLIKNVGDTKYGPLLELRMQGPGHRIFFVHRNGCSPKILIGGFYQKGTGSSQNTAIQDAKMRIDNYIGD